MDIDLKYTPSVLKICIYCKKPISTGVFCNDECSIKYNKRVVTAKERLCKACHGRYTKKDMLFCDEYCLASAMDNLTLIKDPADNRLKQKLLDFKNKIQKRTKNDTSS